MTPIRTVTVEVLRAEVRVLMVGTRQLTLSVFRQLDFVPWEECGLMGRVQDPREKDSGWFFAIGVSRADGSLVRTWLRKQAPPAGLIDEDGRNTLEDWAAAMAFYTNLPLIVLAGLT